MVHIATLNNNNMGVGGNHRMQGPPQPTSDAHSRSTAPGTMAEESAALEHRDRNALARPSVLGRTPRWRCIHRPAKQAQQVKSCGAPQSAPMSIGLGTMQALDSPMPLVNSARHPHKL